MSIPITAKLALYCMFPTTKGYP